METSYEVMTLPDKVRVILITDGDRCAQHVIEEIARELGLRCISASAGNPTPISGEEIVRLIKSVPYDPVLVMFDDRGKRSKGKGERAMEYVANHPDIEVLGAVAVASNTEGVTGVKTDVSITDTGQMVNAAVDKNGTVTDSSTLTGDTVDILNKLSVPLIVGIGDIGKMDHADDIRRGAPVTKRAILEILRRSGVRHGGQT